MYRFFSDRDEILDALLERHVMAVDDLSAEAEASWSGGSRADLLNAEFDFQVGYYRQHPSSARLWFGGRSSETVVRFVHRRIQILSDRLHQIMSVTSTEPLDPRAVLLIVELADRAIELAYRGRDDFDPELLEMGRAAVLAYVATLPGA